MGSWKEKICQGNNCFNEQHWHLAEKAYLDAANELEQEWFTNLTDVQLMMAWMANMHNLATLYETLDSSNKCKRLPGVDFERSSPT
ncbi:hypothetical protein [Endozoicomonas numazuensis]|nr:hypothetical protein [Endozoicomonas numazuensis]